MGLISQMLCKHREKEYLFTLNEGTVGISYSKCKGCGKVIEDRGKAVILEAMRHDESGQLKVKLNNGSTVDFSNSLLLFKLDYRDVVKLLYSHMQHEVSSLENKIDTINKVHHNDCVSFKNEIAQYQKRIDELGLIRKRQSMLNTNFTNDQDNLELYNRINTLMHNLSFVNFGHLFNMGFDESIAYSDVESKVLNSLIQKVKGYDWMYDRVMWDKSGDNVVIYRKRINRNKKKK